MVVASTRIRMSFSSRLHHAGPTDGEQISRAIAKGRRGPRLARGSCGRVRPGVTITQHRQRRPGRQDRCKQHLEIEWPPKIGRLQTFPEVERANWFALPTARTKILEGQPPYSIGWKD